MVREPDWESLSELEFLLARRLTEPLDAALVSISLTNSEPTEDHPPDFWQDQARNQVRSVLNLIKAWQSLIRYKIGEPLPPEHRQTFRLQDLLNWLAQQLQLVTPLTADENLMLEADRETVQEALLLLYSVAYTLGPSVHLLTQSTGQGVWFRVRYAQHGNAPCPTDLDSLLEKLSGNWRSEGAAFELRTAADFVALNGSELQLQTSEQFCGFAFFAYAAGHRDADTKQPAAASESPELAPATVTPVESLPESKTTEGHQAASGLPEDDDDLTPVMVEKPWTSLFAEETEESANPKTNPSLTEDDDDLTPVFVEKPRSNLFAEETEENTNPQTTISPDTPVQPDETPVKGPFPGDSDTETENGTNPESAITSETLMPDDDPPVKEPLPTTSPVEAEKDTNPRSTTLT